MPTASEIETTDRLEPQLDGAGLISCIVMDAASGDVLMLAHMNEEALERTIKTGEAWFWSRSRQEPWRKGESSGNTLAVSDMLIDCDQDAVLLKVKVAGQGVACHTGRRSCFYRRVALKGPAGAPLTFV
jgi:phosphoribosyl-AMP cyclohydrolase